MRKGTKEEAVGLALGLLGPGEFNCSLHGHGPKNFVKVFTLNPNLFIA